MKILKTILFTVLISSAFIFIGCDKEDEALESNEEETSPIVNDTTANNDSTAQNGNSTAEWRDIHIHASGISADITNAIIGTGSNYSVFKSDTICPNTSTQKTFSHNFGNSNLLEIEIGFNGSMYSFIIEFNNGEYIFTPTQNSIGINEDAIAICNNFDINDVNEPIVILITHE